ncbi:hypothetical protein LV75_006490 [Actinokineospora diospyrosa]|uniref:Uncharacterized protein n=1 Tax=Actinokineospora diospyrosa TaxID=103728 RepID=A0ABT1IMR7_9PSEU|nr:hypothetical protein [Actinokineospora diospyrosa]
MARPRARAHPPIAPITRSRHEDHTFRRQRPTSRLAVDCHLRWSAGVWRRANSNDRSTASAASSRKRTRHGQECLCSTPCHSRAWNGFCEQSSAWTGSPRGAGGAGYVVVDELAGQGVQHHIDAPTAGRVQEPLLELDGPGGGDVVVVDPHGAQGVPLTRARGGEHLGTPVPGELHRRHAHPARGGVDQHGLAGAQVGEVDETEIGREEGTRNRGGLLEGPPSGHRRQQPLVHDGNGPNAPESIMPVTRSPGVNWLPTTIPVPSRPMNGHCESVGTSPRATARSRKFTPAARTATRICPGPSGMADSGAGTRARLSKAPGAEVVSRHGSMSDGGTSVAVDAAGISRGT